MAHRPVPSTRDIAAFTALIATALAMGGGLAHALELPNKIGLTREQYFIVQQIYSGWNRLALVIFVEAASLAVLVGLYRRKPAVLYPLLAAFLWLLGAQAVFWLFTYPANQQTVNWTIAPENWEALRRQWEYSHLAGAAMQFLTLAFLIIAVLRAGHERVAGDSRHYGEHRTTARDIG